MWIRATKVTVTNSTNQLSTDRLFTGAGRSQIVSELTLGGNEFDRYEISLSPVTIAFFLREFYVSTTLTSPAALSYPCKNTNNI